MKWTETKQSCAVPPARSMLDEELYKKQTRNKKGLSVKSPVKQRDEQLKRIL